MKEKNIATDQSLDTSKFQLVLAAAKRSKQINRMAKERGLPPNQVASIKTKNIKPPTIALMEMKEGKVTTYLNNGKEKPQEPDAIPSEESSQEASIST
jgi:DNA-directed RNA polymerase omega subunit